MTELLKPLIDLIEEDQRRKTRLSWFCAIAGLVNVVTTIMLVVT